MLPAGIHVWKVFSNESTGLLSIPKDSINRLFIDCSTIDTRTCQRIGEAVEASGLGSFADAPVSVCFFSFLFFCSKSDSVCREDLKERLRVL